MKLFEYLLVENRVVSGMNVCPLTMLLHVLVPVLAVLAGIICSSPELQLKIKYLLRRNCSIGSDGRCETLAIDEEQAISAIQLPEPDENSLYDLGLGEAQNFDSQDKASRRVAQRMLYHHESRLRENPDDPIYQNCENKDASCVFWASLGECEKNPTYMKKECAPACRTCDHLSMAHRCPIDEEYMKQQIWHEGGLDAMFRRIVQEYGENVTIMSSPDEPLQVSDGQYDSPPWVITVDNFLTLEECQTLIDLGAKVGYERSSDVGEEQFDGSFGSNQNSGRTSYNSWCQDECYEHPISQGVLKKMEKLTGIPDANAEHLQLLRYEENQYYNRHHDYIEFHQRRSMGVRILTVFLYLNNVTEGGETYFNDLDITSSPIQGRALLWPSVLDSDPNAWDDRTHHEAMPVVKGMKYGANAWYHQRDFKDAHSRGCSD